MATPTYKPRTWSRPSKPPVPEEQKPPVEVVPPPPPVVVAEPEPLKSDQYEPRVLTFEEVCRYLNLKPELRKFFVNKRGEYVRKLVEEYAWTVDIEKRVHKIPKWFIEGGLQ